MIGGLSAAVTGLDTQNQEMSVISNNLANQTTPGYKAAELDFASLLSQTYNQGTSPTAPAAGVGYVQGGTNPFQIGLGVETTGAMTNQSEGTLSQTGNPADFAIQGNGYFIVSGSQGTTYTRDGQLSVDAAGNLVSQATGGIIQGYSTVNPGNPPTLNSTQSATLGPLSIPETIAGNGTVGTAGTQYQLQSFSVGQTGKISATYQSSTGSSLNVSLGTMALAEFANPNGLVATGASQFAVGPNSGPANVQTPTVGGAGQVIQGALEQSNTDLTQSMAQLIEANGAYAADAKVLTIAQNMSTALDQAVQ